jgi:membrane fusion protein (multidrug efflux system)
MVSPGTQVISLVQNDVWAQANYKEAQVRHIHPGDPISVRVDFLSGVPFNGKAERPSPASGARFALLLPDNATGNFTKIVQRLSVKIVLDRGQPALERSQDGLSVTATVCTFGGAQ